VLSAAEVEEWTSNTVADRQLFIRAIERLKFLRRFLTLVRRIRTLNLCYKNFWKRGNRGVFDETRTRPCKTTKSVTRAAVLRSTPFAKTRFTLSCQESLDRILSTKDFATTLF
jgi:hypothetical protein